MKRFTALALAAVISATSLWGGDLATVKAQESDAFSWDEPVATEEVTQDISQQEPADETASVWEASTEESQTELTAQDEVIASETEESYDNILGDHPINKSNYNITFTIETDGEQFSRVYALSAASSTQALNEFSFYSDFTKDRDAFLAKYPAAHLTGWTVYTDGHNTPEYLKNTIYMYNGHNDYYDYYISYLDSDFKYYKGYSFDEDGNYNRGYNIYTLDTDRDYHFVAQMTKQAAENIYVTTIPSVYYDTKEHVLLGTDVKPKTQTPDLRVEVFYGDGYEDSNYELVPGRDYEVEYKNNTNASVELVREGDKAGSYVKTWTDKNSRPTVSITGIGRYKGFSADVYFDILPTTIGGSEYHFNYIRADEYGYQSPYYADYGYSYYSGDLYSYTESEAAGLSGLANSYLLKDVKKIKTKVTKAQETRGYAYNKKSGRCTWKNYGSTVKTLTEGTDYKLELYKWDENKWVLTNYTAPDKIDATGDYLCLVRGIGNYCGALYGWDTQVNYDDNEFNAGGNGYSANPQQNQIFPLQFTVVDDDKFDIAKTKVSIKKKSQKYVSDTTTYGADDFRITVKNKKGETLTLWTDYFVYFDEKYYYRPDEKDNVNYGTVVSAANEYDVWIIGLDKYYGSKLAGKVKITGLTLKASMFNYKKTVGYGEANTFTAKDTRLNLTNTTDPYYVNVNGGNRLTKYKPYRYYNYIKYIDGSGCGNAINPAKTLKIKWTMKYKTIKISKAIQDGLLDISLGAAQYNAGGSFPAMTVKYYSSSTSTGLDGGNPRQLYQGLSIGSFYIKGYGYGWLTVSGKNNKVLGTDTATLTIKGTGVLTGSITMKYSVEPRKIIHIYDYYSDSYEIDPGDVYALITDKQQGSGSLDDPDVKLYQSYRDSKGYHEALLKSGADFVLSPDKSISAKGIAAMVYVNNGTAGTFNFAPYSESDTTFKGVQAGIFGLYEKAVTTGDVKSVTIGTWEKKYNEEYGYYDSEYKETDYTVTAGKLSYEPLFTGGIIEPNLEKMTVGDTVLKNYSDFYSYLTIYGENRAAGTVGTIKPKLQYNSGDDSYPYGGEIELKFDIKENAKTTL